jgi:hypothetical protein
MYLGNLQNAASQQQSMRHSGAYAASTKQLCMVLHWESLPDI